MQFLWRSSSSQCFCNDIKQLLKNAFWFLLPVLNMSQGCAIVYYQLVMSQKKQIVQAPNYQSSPIEIVTVGGPKYSLEPEIPPQLQLTPVKPPPPSAAPGASAAPVQEQPQIPSQQILEDKKQNENEPEEVLEAEEEQNLEQEQGEQSNSQKSDKKGKNNSENVDERREELPSSRKCFNKRCSSKKIYKKIRSRVQEGKYRFFCKSCYESYLQSHYCEFCEQIYSSNGQSQDDDKWVGCDKCDKWNHKECQKKYRNNELDQESTYLCLVCTQKAKVNEKGKKQEKQPAEQKIATKQKIEINRDQRIPIFHKKFEAFPNLDYFLQSYGFRLWINQNQIRQDLQSLRANCLRTGQQDSSKNKFKKTKND